MTYRTSEPLAVQHRLDGFDCGQPTLNQWLVHHARQAQASGSARTFVVADQDDRVAGYFSLTVGQIDTAEAPERLRQGMGRFPLPVALGCTKLCCCAWVSTQCPRSLMSPQSSSNGFRRTVSPAA